MKKTTIFGGLALALVALVLLFWVALQAMRDAAQPQSGETNPYAEHLLGTAFEPPLTIDPFSLPSTTGAPVDPTAQPGKVTLLYFGYLSCPDFCPTTMAKLKRVYEGLGVASANVQVVFVTVDPERDTLDLLTRYVNAFNPAFIGLRGETMAEITPMLEQFGVTALHRPVDSALGYLIDHSTSVYALDGNGQLVARFAYDLPYESILQDVQVLLNNGK